MPLPQLNFKWGLPEASRNESGAPRKSMLYIRGCESGAEVSGALGAGGVGKMRGVVAGSTGLRTVIASHCTALQSNEKDEV